MQVSEWVRNTQLAIEGVYQREREQGTADSPSVDPAFLEGMYTDVSTRPLVFSLGGKARSPKHTLNRAEHPRWGGLGDVWTRGVTILRETLSLVGAGFDSSSP